MERFLLIIFLTFMISCKQTTDNNVNYVEAKPSFYSIRNENLLTNKWIRNPRNLNIVHETFKSFGYNKLLANFITEDEFIYKNIYIRKPIIVLIDSLEKSYDKINSCNKYYREFWQRRKTENNDSIVYLIIKDINAILNNNTQKPVNKIQVNDTLRTLLEIEYIAKPITNEQALRNFNTLKSLGFHQSAYNLLYEHYDYQNIKWNQKELKETLIKSNKYIQPWFEDDIK